MSRLILERPCETFVEGNRRIPSILTEYNWKFYRSQLEARWAKFFESLPLFWKIEYEPKEWGYWLPDFLFYKKVSYRRKPLRYLIEIKPTLEIAEKEIPKHWHDIWEARYKRHPITPTYLFVGNPPDRDKLIIGKRNNGKRYYLLPNSYFLNSKKMQIEYEPFELARVDKQKVQVYQ